MCICLTILPIQSIISIDNGSLFLKLILKYVFAGLGKIETLLLSILSILLYKKLSEKLKQAFPLSTATV
jgi:hypothetical protein